MGLRVRRRPVLKSAHTNVSLLDALPTARSHDDAATLIVLLPSRLCFCDNLLPVRGAFGVPLWLRSLSTLLPLVLALLRVVALSDEGLEINVGVHACAWRACAFC